MANSVAIADALRSLALGQTPEGHWLSDDGQVGALVWPAGVLLGWWDVAWAEPAAPAPVLRSVRHLPTAFLDSPQAQLANALNDVRADRAAAMHVCARCGTECLPGQMHDERWCQGCAERDLGVVH